MGSEEEESDGLIEFNRMIAMNATLESPQARPLPHEAEPQRYALAQRLASLRRVIRWNLLMAGLTRTLALVIGLCAVSLVVDRLLRLETSSRIALGGMALVAILIAGWRWIVVPLKVRLENLDLAELLERRTPGLGRRIADLLQLPELLATPQFASAELVRAAIADHAEALQAFDFRTFINRRRIRWDRGLLGALLVGSVIGVALWPEVAGVWARRWLLAEDVRWPQVTYLSLDGLNGRDRLLTPRGEPLILQLTAAPNFTRVDNGWQLAGRGKPLVVERDQSPPCAVPEKVSIVYSFSGGTTKQANFTHFQNAEFRYELPPLVEPVDVTISGGDDWFGPVRIEPIDRPTVAELKLTSRSPGSTTDEVHTIGTADEPLLFLKETRLELRLAASEPLSRAQAVQKDGPPEALESIDDKTFRLCWTMQEPRTCELRLFSAESGLTSKPYFLTVGLLHDREPRLTLRATGLGRRVTPQARLPLAIHAADDFGLATLGLELERTELLGDKPKTTTNTWPLENFGEDPGRELPPSLDLTPELNLAEHAVVAGQSIRLCASATDRCALGAHKGVSRWLAFQIVTPEELFYEILMRQREQRAKFAAALAQAQTQTVALEKLDKVSDAPPLARMHQSIGRQVWQIANQLDGTLREMTLNDLGNATARQLLADGVIQPLRELHNDPIERLRQQLGQLRAQDAIEPAQREAALGTQRQIVRSMERILAKMSEWESFVDVVNQLRQIIKLQSELKESTHQAQKKQTDELFDE